ncbi:MAG: efflux RND transporter periplasmic adaptor subunit [Tateyamaria sp.]|jgi:multidrug efflux system membrane fusion protein|nr:efflux RND transporter periplasmic adaptor subunit [Tateyamaria sp.]
MRILSFILAVMVAVALYLWIIERERTIAYVTKVMAGNETSEPLQTDEEIEVVEETPNTNALIKVVAHHSVAREIDSAVILRGQTEAARQVDVRAETTSTVVSPPLRKGAFIDKGQLLCQLDLGIRASSLAEARARVAEAVARKTEAKSRIPESEARVAEAMARLAEAQVNQNAASRLSEGGFASETRVKSAEAAFAAAEASVEAARSGVIAAKSGMESADAAIQAATAAVASAEKEIERLDIHAPFAGILESDTAELGSLLQPGSLCATVIQLDPIKLVAFVPETQVNRVAVGAVANARLAAGGETLTGLVKFLSRSADPTTRTFRVEIEVPNPDLNIRDGQTAEITVVAPGARAHLLPGSALTLNEAGKLGLRTVSDDGVVAFLPTSVLRDTAQGMWLTGLPDEIDVIVIGQEFVTQGVKVDPTFEEQTQ